MAYPTTLDNFTDPSAGDNLNSPSHAGLHTSTNTAIEAIQTKLGVDSSAVATSIDYLLTNTSSSNPGHKHTLANGATDVTATAAELNIMDGVTATTAELNKLDGVVGDVVGTTDSQTLSSKTLTSPVINTSMSGTAFLDEDSMTSNSATKVASQQSIKAYVDTAVSTRMVSGKAKLSSDSTLANNSEAKIQLNTESWDVGGIFNTSTDRFEPSVNGYYIVTGGIGFANLGATCQYQIQIRVNGNNAARRADYLNSTASGDDPVINVSSILYLTTSNYVELYGYQNSGSSVTISSTEDRTYLSIHLLSEA